MPINRYVLFFALAIGGCLVDLVTKSIVFSRYFMKVPVEAKQAQQWWIDGVLGIQTSTNGGALFGIGQGMHLWFAGLSLVAIVGILVWLFYFKGAIEKLLTISLGLITGGILGNLYDRLGFGYSVGSEDIKYHVRDWLFFRWEGISFLDPWPNFNIADSLLVCGAALLFIHAFFFAAKDGSKKVTEKPPESSSEQSQTKTQKKD